MQQRFYHGKNEVGLMNMLQASITVNHLSKVYYEHVTDTIRDKFFDKKLLSSGDKLVLDNINFSFNSGDIIGVIGRNGAGKSTLLSILAGVSQQTHGEVNICGKVTAVMTLGIGLREDLTGRENIYLDGEIQGKTHAEISLIIDEIINFAELGNFIDRPVKTYSTGMKSRLAFSMLVNIEPEILIIDEALSAGDVFFAEKASQKIKDICQKGKIVIIVSHSMRTIEDMCNRCIWIEQGTILMDGSPAEVTNNYSQKIREEDQAKALEEQQVLISHIVPHANYKIHHVSMRHIEDEIEQNVFYTQDSLMLEITLKSAKSDICILKISIERIDGFLVSQEQFNIDSNLTLQLSLPSLVLNKGYYQLKCEIFEKEERTNYIVRSFEVKNDQMAKGGMSLLQYPAEITLITEEVNVCSDSIALITE